MTDPGTTKKDLLAEIASLRQQVEELKKKGNTPTQAATDQNEHIRFLQHMERIDRAIRQGESKEEMLGDVLETVLDVFSCDRAWLLYPCDPESPTWSVPMERTRPEFPGAMALGQTFSMTTDVREGFRELLATPGPISAEISPGETEWDPDDKYAVLSAISLVIYPKVGKPWNFGLHQCAENRTWTSPEADLLLEIGRRIADGLSNLLILRELKESEARFRRLLDNAPDLIYRMSLPSGCYEYVSPAATEITGYPPATFIEEPQTIKASIHPDWLPYFDKQWEDLLVGNMPPTYEFQIIHGRTGETRWIHQRNTLILDEAGKPIAVEGIARDFTDEKLAQDKLAAAQATLSAAIAQSPAGILIADAPAGTIRLANPAALNIRGGEPRLLTEIDIQKHTVNWQTFLPDGSPYPPKKLPLSRAILHGEVTRNEELVIRDNSGKDHWVSANAAPIRDSHGNITAGIVIFHDITTQREDASARRDATHLFGKIISESPIGICIYDEIGQCVVANEAVGKIIGATRDQVLSQNYNDIPSWRESGLWTAAKSALEQSKTTNHILKITTTFGKTLEIDCYFAPFTKEDSVHLLFMITDVTERRIAEEALRLSEEHLRSLIRVAPTGIGVEIDRVIQQVNDRMCKMLGYSAEELSGKPTRLLYASDADHDLVGREKYRQIEDGGTGTVETRWRRKDGRIIDILLSSTPLDRADLSKGVTFTALDITVRKQHEAEKLALERQLQHAQKLESLGVLAGGIAHDFNNLLMAILGNADLALDKLSPMSPVRSNLEEIENTTRRAADLAKQMLAYSGRGQFVVEPVDSNELVEEITHLLEVSISKKAVIKYNLAPGIPTFNGDATQVRQIIMNLITNASEAIGEKSGVIALSTGMMHCDREYLDSVNESLLAGIEEPLPCGSYVFIEVADTGCGMDASTMGKVFDPFFTTKFTGRGLGMSATLGIVRGHKGAIKIYSEIDKGTTFKVLFPANVHPGEEITPKVYPGRIADDWQGSGTILVADDEKTICDVSKQMLGRLGFDVITAADGREALALFNRHQDDIACVLLDLTMPHMDGVEAFREMRRIKPDVKVILCSGYNKHDATQQFAGKGLAGFIEKPYGFATLKEQLLNLFGSV